MGSVAGGMKGSGRLPLEVEFEEDLAASYCGVSCGGTAWSLSDTTRFGSNRAGCTAHERC
jgi:hypothetical protein